MSERYFVIADIHGEMGKLRQLMALLYTEANLDLTTDLLVQLGDKNDRGPETFEVMAFFHDLTNRYPGHVFCLWGNHETMFRDACIMGPMTETFYYGGNGGQQTLESYSKQTGFYGKRSLGNSVAMVGHANFLNQSLLYLETDEYFFCHAPIPRPVFRRTTRDFRLDEHCLTWSYVDTDEEIWVDPDPVDGKLCVYGHIHGLKVRPGFIEVPGVRQYGNAVLLDTGCGCADEGYVSCLELPARIVYDSRGMKYPLGYTLSYESAKGENA